MTEASICEASNSDTELLKVSTRELTPDNDSDGKHSQSSDSPADTTGGDENTSRNGDTVCGQENEHPLLSNIDGNENKFVASLRQKDVEIKRLTDENKSLRAVLAEKTNRYDVRVQELVEELERHAELVERLQTQLTEAETQIRQKHQHIASLRQQLNNQRRQLQNYQQNHSSAINTYHQQPPAMEVTESQKANNRIGGNRGEDIGVAFLGELLAAGAPTNSDEVCAALNAFIEKNRNANGENFTLNPNDEELAQPIIDYLNKIIMDSPTVTSNQVENAFAMLLDAASIENGGGNGNGANNNLNYGFEKDGTAGLRSPSGKSAQKSGATVREYVNGTRSGCGEQHFYRGAAGTSASSTANTSALVNGSSAKMKFSQHALSTSLTSPNANVLARPSTSSQTSQFSSPAPLSTQRTLLAYNTPSAGGSAGATTTPSSSTTNAKPLTEEEQRTITEMQERVAANVARLGSRPLNTLEIAKQCKRLMLSYNIGQRLFAKAVMCQVVKSQGSLSELLSKPRSWHKLTDKGREAFRRIYGWLSDDVAIELLCTLSPRRVAMPCDRIEHPTPESLLDNGESDGFGEETATGLVNGGGGFEDALSSLLFSEGNGSDFKAEEEQSKYFHSSNNAGTKGFSSPDTSISGSSPVSHQYFNTHSVSTNGVASPPVSAISTSSLVAVSARNTSGPTVASNTSNGSRWRHDDIPREKIIDIFEAEKAKLREQVKQCVDDNLISNGIPLINGAASGDSTPASPNASSVHSLVTAAVSLSSGSGRLKVEPAPILQEQFEKYPLLDTEEVVKQVKDYLSRHSVSQRQFGETVLGLSQGSVSDLLARPKGWSSLTHKGREPFIRMKIFLDEHANDELPPASLNNNNNGSGGSERNFENGTLDKIDGLNFGMEEECRDTPEPDILFKTFLDQVKSEKSDANNEIQEDVKDTFDSDTPPPQQEKLEKSSVQDFAASLAAVAHQPTTKTEPEEYPLDTADLCRRIKEFLSKNGISQRAFGEHVMSGMSSGSVSDLLSRPKPWPALSPKAREQYTKMSQFLHDDRAMVALRLHANTAITNSTTRNGPTEIVTVRDLLTTKASGASNFVMRQNGGGAASATAEFITSPLPSTAFAATAPRQGATFSSGVPPKFSRLVLSHQQQQMRTTPHQHQQQLGSPTSSASNLNFSLAPKRKAPSECSSSAEYNQDASGAQSAKKIPRFQRTIITDAQKEALLFVYAEQQRPSAKTIDLLSIRLGLSSRTVTNWFHNYRTRQKAKEQKLTNEARDNGLPPPVLKPNPLQVADPTTKSWYKDLCEILAQNCNPHDSNGVNDNNNSSIFNDSDGYASFLNMTTGESGDDAGGYVGDNCSSMNDGLFLDSDFVHQNGRQEGSVSDYGGRSIGVGVEMEDDEEADLRMMTPKSGCSSTGAGATAINANDGSTSGVTALDRVIARMHNRLAATTSGDNA